MSKEIFRKEVLQLKTENLLQGGTSFKKLKLTRFVFEN